MNIFTIDLEEWFHINEATWLQKDDWIKQDSRVETNTTQLLNLLSHSKQKATFFTMGWIAEVYPDLVRQIHKEGHEIGYHSYYHRFPGRQGRLEFEKDLHRGLDIIQEVCGVRPNSYRAPNFSLDETSTFILPILLKNGITISSSTRAHRKIGTVSVPNTPFSWQCSNGKIMEFPLNRIKNSIYPFTYSGSGFFRILPIGVINQLFKKSEYNMAYFHPNDIDQNHPTISQLSWRRNWMNKVGTKNCSVKLAKLLTDHAFMTIGEANLILDNNPLPEITIN